MAARKQKELLCYIASPLGFSEGGRRYYYQEIVPFVEQRGFRVLDPWTLQNPDPYQKIHAMELGLPKVKKLNQANRVTGTVNAGAILRCHLLLGILDGAQVDDGTASEIGFAAGKEKKIEGFRTDFRLASDNLGAQVNLQIQYFINVSGGSISTTSEKLSERLLVRQQELLNIHR